MEKKIMHEEHKEEIKMLKDAIKHYEEVLKKPDFKYLDGSTRHEDALRIVTNSKKQLIKLELLYV
jgi:hypothetical protein